MISRRAHKSILCVLLMLVATTVISLGVQPLHAAGGETIIELWDTVTAPAPVALQPVKLDPATTAFLILDIEELTCDLDRRPRCIASVPAIKRFLDRAKSSNVAIVYSLTRRGTRETILPEVRPTCDEPIVKSSVDKFYGTDLENILRERGITTVVIAGTTAEGAVLHTATGAAMRGFQVVIPVDGMSAADLYAEQYTAWHMLNAPGTRQRTILTRFGMIEF
ncbi:MAG: cysteine hydrolase [Deltaproteobacteria bacterium]|nr:cysteine hydrolase [Deltaproteobacteria bacterium]